MAADEAGIVIVGNEKCGHRLVVGDALGVIALRYAANLGGQLHGALLHYLVVAYGVDHRLRCYQSYAVEHLLGEEHIGHLDYTF